MNKELEAFEHLISYEILYNDDTSEKNWNRIILIRQALNTPKITSEQVKEDILNLEEINKNLEEWEHIKQYISQLENKIVELRKEILK